MLRLIKAPYHYVNDFLGFVAVNLLYDEMSWKEYRKLYGWNAS